MADVVVIGAAELKSLLESTLAEKIAQLPAGGAREVMTLPQVAEFLDLHQKTVLKYVETRGLPCHWISAREPRFIRTEVLEWVKAQLEKGAA